MELLAKVSLHSEAFSFLLRGAVKVYSQPKGALSAAEEEDLDYILVLARLIYLCQYVASRKASLTH